MDTIWNKLKKTVKYFEFVHEKVQRPCAQFGEKVKEIRSCMEKTTMDASKVILFYVPIVTRPGIDIEAALQKLSGLEDKYVALVVLHHTFDRESVVPDSSRIVNREKTITVDCLFHEDEGLLKCQRNDDAIKKVAKWLRDVKYQAVQHFEKRKMKKTRGDTFENKEETTG